MSTTTPKLGLYVPASGDGSGNGLPWGPQMLANFQKIDDIGATGTGKGSEMVGYLAPYTGAVATTQSLVNGRTLHLFDFLTPAQIADAQSGTRALDLTIPLQTAIDAAIANQKKLIWPRGAYKITSPLLIMKFSGGVFTYASFEMEGEKTAWEADFGATINNVTLDPTFNDRPAVIIQNGRSVKLKNLLILGTTGAEAYIGATLEKMMVMASFNRDSSRDQRYSPSCAIAIDPFGTSVPADGGYPGMTSYYVATAAGSSRVILENVIGSEFVVGCIITPNGTTQNAENIVLDNCTFNFCKTGVSVCQSQSRSVVLRNCNLAFNYYCVNTVNYGARQGSTPTIQGGNMSGKYLFNFGTTFGFPNVITGVYAESFASIGFFGINSGFQCPTILQGCTFAFRDWFGVGPHPDHHLVAYGPLEFDSCLFDMSPCTYPGPIRMYHFLTAPLTFRNCGFTGHTLNEPHIAVTTGSNGIEQAACYFYQCVNEAGSRSGNNGRDNISHDLNMYDLGLNEMGLSFAPSGMKLHSLTSADTYTAMNTMPDNKIGLGALTVTAGTNGTASFTVADAAVVRIGDLVFNQDAQTCEGPLGVGTFSTAMVPIGMISNIVGSVVTIQGLPEHFVNGSYNLCVTWMSRLHMASTGDITSGNANILNVTNPTTWKIGHRIKGAGIPLGSVVTNVSATTVTISKNATATTVGIRLYDANLYRTTQTAM